MDKEDILLRVGIVILVLIEISMWTIVPAYYSYESDNGKKGFLSNYLTSGIGGEYYNGNIILYKNSTIVLRHELIHKYIDKHNITIPLYLNELIAYTGQWFIWEKVNITSLNWEDGK